MAGMAHLGVGLAAKRWGNRVPLWVLLVAAYLIDIIWGIFFAFGVETYPSAGQPSPWSHGLLMACVWTLLAAAAAWFIFKDRRTGLFIGFIVFSHWLIDFIAKPMLFGFPNDVGVTLLLDPSRTYGLGLWSTSLGQNIGEYVPLAIGIVIYAWVVIDRRRAAKAA